MSTLKSKVSAARQDWRAARAAALKVQQRQALLEAVARLNAQHEEIARREGPRPRNWKLPPYRSPEFRKYHAIGWITDDEAQQALAGYHARRDRALASQSHGSVPKRHMNDAPRKTNQYAGYMSTEAARDARLTMGSKACLQIIRALCGRGEGCQVNKWYLAEVLGRSVRTVQRYISELAKFGYIETAITRTLTGAYSGLKILILGVVLPCWTKTAWVAEWLERRGFPDKTFLTQKNYSPESSFLNRRWEQHFELRKSLAAHMNPIFGTT